MKPGWPIAIVAAMTGLVAWPALMLQGRTAPVMSCFAVTDAWERIGAAGRFFHDLKNLMTELFRCDAQWWSKFTSFTWVMAAIVILSLAVWAITLLIKLRRKA